MTIVERVQALPVIAALLAITALPRCLPIAVQPSATAAPTPAARSMTTPTTTIVVMPTATTQIMATSAGEATVTKRVGMELLGVT
jgi:uncharacterized RDD family membrane protein YckC